MSALSGVIPPLHKEGHRFVVFFAVGTGFLFLISNMLGWLGVVLTLWCAWFFRDPDRHTPIREGLVVSPVDGVVNLLRDAVPPVPLKNMTPRGRVSIFMNVFNCHVVRMPVDGRIVALDYRPGRYFNAALEKASEENERLAIHIETPWNTEMVLVLIAGLVARRIVWNVEEGQELKAGERVGIIRFGSRADVYLDENMSFLIDVGQSMMGGESVLADHLSSEKSRHSLVR